MDQAVRLSPAERTLRRLVELQGKRLGDRPCLVADGVSRSYAELAVAAARFAGTLTEAGVERGDRVAIVSENRWEILQCLLGCAWTGAVLVPINTASRGAQLQHILTNAGPKVVAAEAQLLERVAAVERPAEVVHLWRIGPGPETTWAQLTSAPFPGASDPVGPTPTGAGAPLAILYTSGTTGPSKGVRAAHAAFWNYGRCFIAPFVTQQDRYLQPLPMFYTAGTGITYSMLQAGGSLAFLKGFSPRTFWDDVRRFEATITIVIHGMVTFLLDQPESPDDAENPLRTVYMGPLTRHEDFARRFGCRVYTAYGMTEVPVPIVSGLDPKDERSCGKTADPEHYELRLVDEHDVPVPAGTPGELVVRHSLPWTINSGYKNMPEANATAWRNGWFHTGDEFLLDEAGNFFFLDRKKDVIRRRGVNISSHEVEAEVESHPLVKEAAAVAVRNPDLEESAGDEEVKVIVVLEEGAALDPVELVDYLVPRMPRHWVPRFVEFASALPRTESFKVKKSDLRDAGVTAETWDRERAGMRFKREVLS
jgi:carnitine-CoA ligase